MKRLSLAIVLKKLREEKGMTIIELAQKAGLGKGTVGDIETGKSKGSRKSLNKIAEALNLSIEDKNKLDSAFLGREIMSIEDPRAKNLKGRERLQYEELLNQNALFFNDESISEEDKKKMVDALTEAFYAIKKSNKKTK